MPLLSLRALFEFSVDIIQDVFMTEYSRCRDFNTPLAVQGVRYSVTVLHQGYAWKIPPLLA